MKNPPTRMTMKKADLAIILAVVIMVGFVFPPLPLLIQFVIGFIASLVAMAILDSRRERRRYHSPWSDK